VIGQDQPDGTVVIPVFNGESGLKRAIESALQQGSSDWVVLVSDNASTDGTASVLQEFVDDPRVRVMTQPFTLPVLEHFAVATSHVQTAQDTEVLGVIPWVVNEVPSGLRGPAFSATDVQRLNESPRAPLRWFFKRRFAAVNVIYGVWRTDFLADALCTEIMQVDLGNPMSDRAIATRLLTAGPLCVTHQGMLVKAVRPSSMSRLNLQQEFRGFQQVASVLRQRTDSHPRTVMARLAALRILAALTGFAAASRAALSRPSV
jgi:hypothetical protein